MRLHALEGDEELDVDRVLLEDDDLAVALDLAVGASFRDDGQERDTVISAGAGYGYRLTEATGLRLGYDVRMPMGDIDDGCLRGGAGPST